MVGFFVAIFDFLPPGRWAGQGGGNGTQRKIEKFNKLKKSEKIRLSRHSSIIIFDFGEFFLPIFCNQLFRTLSTYCKATK